MAGQRPCWASSYHTSVMKKRLLTGCVLGRERIANKLEIVTNVSASGIDRSAIKPGKSTSPKTMSMANRIERQFYDEGKTNISSSTDELSYSDCAKPVRFVNYITQRHDAIGMHS